MNLAEITPEPKKMGGSGVRFVRNFVLSGILFCLEFFLLERNGTVAVDMRKNL